MQYRGYLATVEYDDEAEIFQGRSVDDLRRELAESVEDYEPEKP